MRMLRCFRESMGGMPLMTLVCLIVAGQAAVIAQEPPTSSEKVQFARGATSATRKGSVKGYDTRDYVLSASEGQTLSVKLASSNGSLIFSVWPQDTKEALQGDTPASEVTEWTGKLPKTGEYAIRVGLMRNDARRGRTAPYTLSISITGGAGGSGGGGGGERSYTRKYICDGDAELTATFVEDSRGTVRIRFGTQDETLQSVPAQSGSKYAKGRTSFLVNGDNAKLASPVLDADCKAQ